MNEMQDKELDDLFRTSSKQPEIPFDPEAWKAMEAKLDHYDRRIVYYRWLAASVIGVVLLGSSIWLTHSYVAHENSGTEKQQQAEALADQKKPQQVVAENQATVIDVESSSVASKNSNSESTMKHKTESSANKQSVDVSVKTSRLNTSKERERHTLKANSSTNDKTSSVDNKQHVALYRKNRSVKSTNESPLAEASSDQVFHKEELSAKETAPIVIDNKQTVISHPSNASNTNAETPSVVDSSALVKGKETKESLSTGQLQSTQANETTGHQTDKTAHLTDALLPSAVVHQEADAVNNTTTPIHLPTESSEENLLSSSEGIPTKEQTQLLADSLSLPDSTEHAVAKGNEQPVLSRTFKNKFSISLLLNPEFSTTDEFSFYKPGFDIGLYGEYYLSNRFSVLSGLIYSKKIYTCSPYDYASAPSYVYRGRSYEANAVSAYCAVLEVPVNLRYKFLNKKSFNLYASAGLSSYIMLKENYNFQYQAYSWTGNYAYEVDNQNRYFFSVGNFSLGIEKYLGNKWSVQAEPYLKTPFSGVGEGKIKLLSTGVYFSIKRYL